MLSQSRRGLEGSDSPAAGAEVGKEVAQLRQIEGQLRISNDDYWATQTGILLREIEAWSAQADHRSEEAVAMMRHAADEEDVIEKLPITPGPIVPAREQLGDLLLEQNQPALAAKEFATTLINSPGRRGAVRGAATAATDSPTHK